MTVWCQMSGGVNLFFFVFLEILEWISWLIFSSESVEESLLTSPFRWKQAIISRVMVLEIRIASKQFLFWHVAIFGQCSQDLLYYVYSKHLMSVRNKETTTASCKVRSLDPNCSRTLRFYVMINIKHKRNLNFIIVLFEINIFMKF